MNDYCNGIACATGYLATESGNKYLVVRNLDIWYLKQIEQETGYKVYESKHNIERDGAVQYVVKARNITCVPALCEIHIVNDFLRAYIEIHGILDMATSKDRKGNKLKRPRLRIYGNAEIVDFINDTLSKNLAVIKKKIQFIKNKIDDKYVGCTCAIYYQSKTEIINILQWIDGKQKNEKIWNKWNQLLKE